MKILQRTGLQRTGPRRAGPRDAGPRRAGPRRAGPRRAGRVAIAGSLALTVAVGAGLTASAYATDPPGRSGAPGKAGAPAKRLTLPKPTGRNPVGTTSLHLTDPSRPDPWVPEAKARELMVTLWYPAKRPGQRRAQYMTPEESKLVLERAKLTDLPPDLLSTVRTNAFTDALPATHRPHLQGRPLVVLSPGFINSRTTLTAMAEDLASRGYVVAGIDHTYESVATSFPDGRVATCIACQVDDKPGFWDKLYDVRAADVSFVLNVLTGQDSRGQDSRRQDSRRQELRPADRSITRWAARSIDQRRIAMAGHSAGGAAAVYTMLKEPRIRAGIDLDGSLHSPIPDGGLAKPFLFIGQEEHNPVDNDSLLEREWPDLTGWKRWLSVKGTAHASFTDLALLGDQLGIDYGASLPGDRAQEITRRYTRAFFDQHLLGRPQPLLDKPSAQFPEVRFCTVETPACT